MSIIQDRRLTDEEARFVERILEWKTDVPMEQHLENRRLDTPYCMSFRFGGSSLHKLWEGDSASFRQLIDVLQTSNERSLLTGQIVTNLPFLARLAQAPLEVCGSKEQLRAWLEGIAGPGGEVPGPPISAMELLGVGGDARTLEDSWRALPPPGHTQRPGYEDVELDLSSWLRTL